MEMRGFQIEEAYVASKTGKVTSEQRQEWPRLLLKKCMEGLQEEELNEEVMVMIFRTMRNLCTYGEDVQCSLVCGTEPSFRELLGLLVQLLNTSSSQSAWDINKVLKPALQFFANSIVGNSKTQQLVWDELMEASSLVSYALTHTDHSLSQVSSMLVYTCCKNNQSSLLHLKEHSSTHIVRDMLLIMERFDNETADTDWSIFFAELLLQSSFLLTFMQNLPIIHTLAETGGNEGETLAENLIKDIKQENQVGIDIAGDHDEEEEEEEEVEEILTSMAEEHVQEVKEQENINPLEKKQPKSESGKGIQAKTTLLKFLEARLSSARVELSIDGERVTGEDIGECTDKLNLSSNTINYLCQKFQELSFLAEDLDWWLDSSQQSSAIHFMLIVRSLGSIAKFGSASLRETIGQNGVLAACITLLSNAQGWIKRATPPKEAKKKANDAPFPAQAVGATRELVRLIANLAFRCKKNQDLFRDLEGFPHVLERFLHDDNNPFIREWSIIAVRNLCEGNQANQDYIRGTETVPREVVNKKELKDLYSMDVEMDERTGRLKVKQEQRK